MSKPVFRFAVGFFLTLGCAFATYAQDKFGTVYFYRDRDTQDSFASAQEVIRKCDALKAKKVKITVFEMTRENPTKMK